MADALGSGSSTRKGVRVRVPLSAPFDSAHGGMNAFIFAIEKAHISIEVIPDIRDHLCSPAIGKPFQVGIVFNQFIVLV